MAYNGKLGRQERAIERLQTLVAKYETDLKDAKKLRKKEVSSLEDLGKLVGHADGRAPEVIERKLVSARATLEATRRAAGYITPAVTSVVTPAPEHAPEHA